MPASSAELLDLPRLNTDLVTTAYGAGPAGWVTAGVKCGGAAELMLFLTLTDLAGVSTLTIKPQVSQADPLEWVDVMKSDGEQLVADEINVSVAGMPEGHTIAVPVRVPGVGRVRFNAKIDAGTPEMTAKFGVKFNGASVPLTAATFIES